MGVNDGGTDPGPRCPHANARHPDKTTAPGIIFAILASI